MKFSAKFSALPLISVAALLVAGLNLGCATTAGYGARVSTWQGQSADDLIRVWGQPMAIEKLDDGNKMLVYSRLIHDPYGYTTSSVSEGEIGRAPASVDLNASDVYIKCATYFEVNLDNKIISIIFRGEECKY